MTKPSIDKLESGAHPLRRRRLLTGTAAALATTGVVLSHHPSAQAAPGTPVASSDAGRRATPYVEVAPGVRLFVRDWGSGKPIVFIHGWPSNHQIFEYQLLSLANQGHRVIGIDLRGFGRSDQPWDGNDYDTWANDIGEVIAALDLRDVTLAGYSMGGAIAAHYVATHEDPRVTKLALLAAAMLTVLPPELSDSLILAVATDRPALFHDFIPSLFHNPASSAYLQWFEGLVMMASPHATVRGLEEARDRDLRSELDKIDVPTRIFHGVHDQVVPFAVAEEQQRLIADAELVPFAESGHALFFEEKDRLSEELARFIG